MTLFFGGERNRSIALTLVVIAVAAAVFLYWASAEFSLPYTLENQVFTAISGTLIVGSLSILSVMVAMRCLLRRKERAQLNAWIERNEGLYLAAQRGDQESLEKLVREGADINFGGSPLLGSSALHGAAENGKLETLDQLLKLGADVTKQDKLGETPLHRAKTADVVYKLVNQGADVNARTDTGKTPLHIATDPNVIKALFNCSASVNAIDNNGNTPLHKVEDDMFVLDGHKAIIDALLKCGAELESTNTFGQTPFLEAMSNKNFRTALYLLQKGARQDAVDNNGHDVNGYLRYKQKERNTHLKECASCKVASFHMPELHFLVSYGAVIPIHSITKIIEENEKKGISINTRDHDGQTALLIAARHGDVATAAELIKHKIDINAHDNEGDTALHKAAWLKDNYAMIELLINNGADVDIKNKKMQTPFDIAQWFSKGQ